MGRHLSAATRAKISASLKAYHAGHRRGRKANADFKKRNPSVRGRSRSTAKMGFGDLSSASQQNILAGMAKRRRGASKLKSTAASDKLHNRLLASSKLSQDLNAFPKNKGTVYWAHGFSNSRSQFPTAAQQKAAQAKLEKMKSSASAKKALPTPSSPKPRRQAMVTRKDGSMSFVDVKAPAAQITRKPVTKESSTRTKRTLTPAHKAAKNARARARRAKKKS